MKVTKELKSKAGIYKIQDLKNRCYIGSSKNLYNRLAVHFSVLRNGKHHSKFMQRVFNKYGEETFSYEILEIIEYNESTLRQKELEYMNINNCVFNSTTPIEHDHSDEMKKRISKTLKRKYLSGEIINPRLDKGRKIDVYNKYGDIIYSGVLVKNLTKILNLSNRSVVNNILRNDGFITRSEFILIEEGKTFKDYIEHIINKEGKRIPVYKLYKDKIELCSGSSKEKVNCKLLNDDLFYYSKINKCYYTYLGLINRLPFWKETSKIIIGQNR